MKYVFLHRHFSYMQIFGTNLRKDIYFENEMKSELDLLKWFTAKSL